MTLNSANYDKITPKAETYVDIFNQFCNSFIKANLNLLSVVSPYYKIFAPQQQFSNQKSYSYRKPA